MINADNSPYIKEHHYETADDFIRAISYGGELYKLFDEHYIFRGHSTDEYVLLPTALRGILAYDEEKIPKDADEKTKDLYLYLATTEVSQIQLEYKFLQDFFRMCDMNGLYVPHIESLRNSFYPGVDGETLLLKGKWLPKEYWELAALAQHHGIRTRLLDWTHDIMVALYFASTGVYNDPMPKVDLSEPFKAHREGRPYPPKHNMEIWALNIDVVMAKPTQMPLKLVQPQYYSNDNLAAQKGMFTFWETYKPAMINSETGMPDVKFKTDRRSLDVQLTEFLQFCKTPAKEFMYRITIPQDAAKEIYAFVEHSGYNASSIFPGYDGVVRFMKEHKEIL